MPRSPKDLFAVAGPCSCALCPVAAPPEPRSIVLVPQAAIDMWLLQLQALPRRKRCSWKSKLLDERGVASRLRYNPAGDWQLPWGSFFEEYNTHISQWLPVYAYEQVRDAFDTFTLASPFAESTDRVMREGNLGGLRELFTTYTTGRPRRNRFVAVPTAAGEPTRG